MTMPFAEAMGRLASLTLNASNEDAEALGVFFDLAAKQVARANVAEQERNEAYEGRARIAEQRDDVRECLLVLANETNIQAVMTEEQKAMVVDALRLSE